MKEQPMGPTIGILKLEKKCAFKLIIRTLIPLNILSISKFKETITQKKEPVQMPDTDSSTIKDGCGKAHTSLPGSCRNLKPQAHWKITNHKNARSKSVKYLTTSVPIRKFAPRPSPPEVLTLTTSVVAIVISWSFVIKFNTAKDVAPT